MTTDWLTASPTPFGPGPRVQAPVRGHDTPAMKPKISALISPMYRSGSWASAEKLDR